MSHPRVRAFAPGRVNLIGEHTDYNDGLCLPFAIEGGVTVAAERLPGADHVEAHAVDLSERDRVPLAAAVRPRDGWRAFVRGAVEELRSEGVDPVPCRIEIGANLPRGAGLASSAALSIALCLALCEVAGAELPERLVLARLCSRIENDWAGQETGLLDQLAALYGREGRALRIDMRGPRLTPVELDLRGHRLANLHSGASRSLAGSGYNERRRECRRAAAALGLESLRDAPPDAPRGLPEPLGRRVRHVISENERVDAAVAAIEGGELAELGRLLDASHRSLRDDYEVSVPDVERAVEACKAAGALGARIVGGGFGGSVLALFPPGAEPPRGAMVVEPGSGARLM